MTSPGATFRLPKTLDAVAVCLNKRKKLLIAYKVLAGLESRNFCYVAAIFVIPSIDWIGLLFTEMYCTSNYVDQLVQGRRTGFMARFPGRVTPDVFEFVLPDEYG